MIGILFMIVGFGALYIALIMFRRNRHFTHHAVHLAGSIVDIKIEEVKVDNMTKIMHRPVIEYIYDTQTWRYNADYDVRTMNQQLDSVVMLRLNPSRPSLVRSEIDVIGRSILILISACLGLLLLVGGAVLLWDVLQNFQENSLSFNPIMTMALSVGVLSLLWLLHLIFKKWKNSSSQISWSKDNAVKMERSSARMNF